MINFIKQYALAIVAVVTIVTFSAFKISSSNAAFMTIPVYFHGDATDQDQVADENNWTILPNGKNCDDVDNLACMILVDNTDLNSSLQLDSAKINLIAVPGGTTGSFIPQRFSGTGTPNPQIINRDN